MIQYEQGTTYNPVHQIYYQQIIPLTKIIGETYPGYTVWVKDKFLYELKNYFTRAYSFATQQDLLAGAALLKNTPNEKKICCLFVDPNFRYQGIASKLIENSFEILQTDKPLITVSNNNIEQLQKLLYRYGFELSRTEKGAYFPNYVEYYFNEHYQK